MQLRRLMVMLSILLFAHALACDHPFYPVQAGASWHYRSSAMGADSEMTRTIAAVTADGFTEEMVVDDFSQELNWRCDAGGLQSLAYSTNEGGFNFETLSVSGVQFPPAAAWTVGASWENVFEVSGSMNQEGMAMTVAGTVTNQQRIVAQESVTVTAGTFEAMKVETTTTMALSSSVMGMNIPMNLSFTVFNWYVQGIGMVRSETDVGMGMGSFVTELVRYTLR